MSSPISPSSVPPRGSRSGNKSQKEAKKAEPSNFHFIYVCDDGPDMRKQNLSAARSFVMTNVRRKKRIEEDEQAKLPKPIVWAPVVVQSVQSQVLLRSMDQSLLDYASLPWPSAEVDTLLASGSQWRWSPLAREFMVHAVTRSFAVQFPPDVVRELWESTVCPSSMVIHSIVWGAAVHRDQLRHSLVECENVEVLSHRAEALRLINEELSLVCQGKIPSEALLFSILSTTMDFRHISQPTNEDQPRVHPFRLAHMPKGWDFLDMQVNYAHVSGLFMLVDRLGGLTALRSHPVAKIVAILDSLMATLELRAPLQPWVEVDEIASLAADLSLNVLNPQPESAELLTPGSSLPTLKRLVGSSRLGLVFYRLQRCFAVQSALMRGELQNMNLRALGGEIASLHHAILSMPPCHDYIGNNMLYEPVRLVSLVFDVGILVPMSPILGLIGRLVRWIKASLECIDLENVYDERVELLVWILFVGGVAAKGMMSERTWFVVRICGLLQRQGMKSWPEIRQLLRSFVWVSDAMDEEAIDLWNNIHDHESLEV